MRCAFKKLLPCFFFFWSNLLFVHAFLNKLESAVLVKIFVWFVFSPLISVISHCQKNYFILFSWKLYIWIPECGSLKAEILKEKDNNKLLQHIFISVETEKIVALYPEVLVSGSHLVEIWKAASKPNVLSA